MMKLTEDIGDLSPRGRAALMGAMALCCVVPMLVLLGVVSVVGAVLGGTAFVVAVALAVLGWGTWVGRHHRAMAAEGESTAAASAGASATDDG